MQSPQSLFVNDAVESCDNNFVTEMFSSSRITTKSTFDMSFFFLLVHIKNCNMKVPFSNNLRATADSL